MFNILFEKYKNEVLEIKPYDKIRDLEMYKKICLGISIVSIVSASISIILSTMLNNNTFILVTIGLIWYLVLIVSMIIMGFISSRPNERKRILQEKVIPSQEKKMIALRGLLNQYGIEIDDKQRIVEIIDYVEGIKEKSKTVKIFRSSSKTISTYILIPIVTYVLTKASEQLSVTEMIAGAIIVVLVTVLIFMVGISFSTIYNDLFNKNQQRYEWFIEDLKEIMIFNNYNVK